MSPRSLLVLAAVLLFTRPVTAQSSPEDPGRRWFIGTSAFVLANLAPDPPSFYQFNVGYRLTERDVVALEAKTWTYRHPLGIPYGPSFEAQSEEYPGHVRGYGLGFSYQRYLWKGLYAGGEATAFLQRYMDKSAGRTSSGFQLFMAVRAGYHVTLFDERCFIEPSVACTAWPVNTNVPATFQRMDDRWPGYFLFEPGLHLGVML